ncbi:phosphatase PAP2 family protein [Novosphingobium beihaiensis]|uniref:Phosphatase PAP2 family protein n=1 Tax=Novosphingobium beihaiensis TaxID=2930389 RepID=A0ABT0BJU2_9SPHN|nr:phosphatase PAP2 family protein [Novosphingobium beihaiensis]MCJ2185315.1 phosphatase PAP2 family protein [Novosphingobium beihaiensis]
MTDSAETVMPATRGLPLDPRKALIVAALCWSGFAAVAWAVATGQSAAIDKAGLLFWRNGPLLPPSTPHAVEIMRGITALGGAPLRSLFAVLAVAVLLALRLRREAVLLAFTVTGAAIVNSAAKALAGRPRPEIVPHLTAASGYSFPSGHSFNGAAIYIAMALTFAALSPRRAVRHTLIACAMALSVAIAWSRVWLGVHWPSDALAGWLGGAGWAFLASALLYRRRQSIVPKA